MKFIGFWLIVAALYLSWRDVYLNHRGSVTCPACGARHRGDSCPDCGQPRGKGILNVGALASIGVLFLPWRWRRAARVGRLLPRLFRRRD